MIICQYIISWHEMNRYFPFTCLSRDGLEGRAVRSIGLTFIIILFCRFSHSLPSLAGMLKMMEACFGGGFGRFGLLGLPGWSRDYILASA